MAITASDSFRRRYFVATFLVSLAMLSAQVTATRLLSYKFYFHYVFLVLSLAQLGLAGAGAWVYALGKRFSIQKAFIVGLLGVAAFAILFLIGYAWLSPAPNIGMSKIDGFTAIPYLIALSVLLVSFYFCSGLFYSTLFSRYRARFNQLYAADLLGAALGCIVCVGLMWAIGPERTFLLSGLLAVVAAMLLTPNQPTGALRRNSAFAFFGIAVVAGLFNVQVFDPNARHPTGAIKDFEWDHLARTDRLGPGHYVIDGDASTFVHDPQSEVEYLVVPPHPAVAIIGVGAGPQLKMALTHAPQSVLAIDINASIIDWATGTDRADIGGIFNQPNVTPLIDEGRHAVRSAATDFDLIVMHAVDTYAATSAGAYSLSENYLYTVEAFKDFYSKLTPQGALAIRRWLFYPPRENLRLFTTMIRALEELGVPNPERHLVVLAPLLDYRQPNLKEWGYILFAKQPFSDEQLARVDQYVADHQWSYLHRPGTQLDTAFSDFVYSADREQFYRTYPYFVWPTYDANPFFFQFVPPFAALYREAVASSAVIYNQSSDMLFVTLIVVAILMVGFLGLPVYLRRHTLTPGRLLGASTLYFVCLGAGFMAVELVSVQIMTLFLGHPTYALSIVLLGMLAFAGVGSALVRRFPIEKVRAVCLVIALVAALAALALLPIIHALIGLPFLARIAITLIYLALIGIPMGMPMALGIRLIGEGNSPQVAWAWACNGGAAVIGTTASMILMVFFGMPTVLVVGAACYLIAYFTFARMRMAQPVSLPSGV